MSVRQSLLAILDQGACYGYQLRSEFHRRTGSLWPLNVGQIYNTLERLERDVLVRRGDADEHGHVYWHITEAGSHAVASWLSTPLDSDGISRDDLAIKVAIAATLPGVDAAALIEEQQEATLRRREKLVAAQHPDTTGPSDPETLARELIIDKMVCVVDAELRWLEHVHERLRTVANLTAGLPLSAERPKRGRPTKHGEEK